MNQTLKANQSTAGSAINGRVILVAEDNKTNQLVLKAMLKTHDVTVLTAENGEEAIQQFKSQKPDLIFMDMAMPVMDGLEATRQIREFEGQSDGDRTPVIALTANAMSGDRERCLSAGMDDYLSKPVVKFQLVRTIENWLGMTNAPAEEKERQEMNLQARRGA